MKNFDNKVAVVTGAGSGIGQALAIQFASLGCRLAICDINDQGLADTAARCGSAQVLTDTFDVADRDAFEGFADRVLDRFGEVDIVINNAGVAHSQRIVDVDYEDFEWIMGINFWGMVYGSKIFHPQLLKRPEASLCNVSSVFGLFSVPTQGTYNATKFGIRGFTEALWHEMDGSNVHVMSIHPGGIRTNIAKAARFYRGPSGESHADGIRNFEKAARTTPEKAADIIINGIRKKKRRVLVGTDAIIIDKIVRMNPTRYWSLLKRMLPVDRD